MLFFPVFVLLLPYYCLRMLKRGGYACHFFHRFGFVPKNKKNTPILWIQAVSVGELEALKPLLEQLKQRHQSVYLTTTTSTGFAIAQKKYSEWVDYIAYFPLDFCVFSVLAWVRIKPKKVVLMESELWPEHLFQAYKRSVPVYLINARCSDRTFARYRMCPLIAKTCMQFLTKILASGELDAQRFQFFCTDKKVKLVGNLKIDAAVSTLRSTHSNLLRQDLGSSWQNATILLGASTWDGEEEMLIRFYKKAFTSFHCLKLILVPRHVERTDAIERILKHYDLCYCLRTQPVKDTAVMLVNTTGELKNFVALADLVFVGKSLDPNFGGQTPIEAAAFGKPIVYGPHMENFRTLCTGLEKQGGAVRCADVHAVEKQLFYWLENPKEAQVFGTAAQQWIYKNKGALTRILAEL
jgi:3-deoxy-D-manno-octulosonic-acid transferase